MKGIIKTLALVFFTLTSMMSTSQIQYEGEPHNWSNKTLTDEIPKVRFGELDMDLVRSQDEVTDQYKETPFRFGIEHEVEIDLLNESKISTVENGGTLFQYGIECEGATSISMNFSSFILPKGCEVFIWNSDRSSFKGKYDYRNTEGKDHLAVGLLHDDFVVVELFVPVDVQLNEVELKLNQITHGYRSIVNKFESADRGPFGSSGPCNINVNCPEGADWQTEKKSVALIVEGGFAVCSGALVNNTNNDGTPYFLTANHCLGGGVGSWVFYFNHEHEDCSGSTGPTDQSVSGSDLVASNSGSDFALLLLDETPPSEFDVEYAGWDATDDEGSVTAAVGIHHPSGDVKKICFEEDAPDHAFQGGAQVWYIDEWEEGVTEGGSSGSPLFDQNHRIIGQLYGGWAACSGSVNNGQPDWYGRFGVSWDGSSPSTRLKDWLDPGNTGVMVLNGYPEGFVSAEYDVASSGILGVESSVCLSSITPTAVVRNNGSAILTSCTITYSINGGDEQVYNWTGSLEQNESEEVVLNSLDLEEGDNILEVVMTNPNNEEDGNDFNNTTVVEFQAFTGPIYLLTVEIVLDDYGSETTWEIFSGSDTYYTGGPYDDDSDGTLVSEQVCVSEGCYQFAIYDSFGDGICCGFGDGSYAVLGPNNNVQASGGDFGDYEVTTVCTPPINVEENSPFNLAKIYPNPANEFIVIEGMKQGYRMDFKIISSTGQLVQNGSINSNSRFEVDVQNLSKGLYFIQLNSDQETEIQKIVIE